MTQPPTIILYTDYKSPYAYLAKDLAYELERDFPVRLDWRPYILDIPSYLGSARVDASGTVLEESRNPHQWRRVRYSYMDSRRQAQKRGLTIRGPQKIWDSTLAAAGMVYAQRAGDEVFRQYHDAVFERFGSARWTSRAPMRWPRYWPGAEPMLPDFWPRPVRCANRLPRSAAPPKPTACSGSRALCLRERFFGAASICPTSANDWLRIKMIEIAMVTT